MHWRHLYHMDLTSSPPPLLTPPLFSLSTSPLLPSLLFSLQAIIQAHSYVLQLAWDYQSARPLPGRLTTDCICALSQTSLVLL